MNKIVNSLIGCNFRWLTLVSACFIVTTVQLGVQNLPFIFSGDLFPADIRVICKVETN